MKTTIIAITLSAAALLATSAQAQTVRFKGNTSGTRELQSATMTKLVSLYAPATKCQKIDLVEPKIIAMQPQLGKDRKPNGQFKVKERWTATGCGKKTGWDVVYTPGAKGTHIGVTKSGK